MVAFQDTALYHFWFKPDPPNRSDSMLYTYHALYPSSISLKKQKQKNNLVPFLPLQQATALAVYNKPDTIFSPTNSVPQLRAFHLDGATTPSQMDFCSGKNLFWGTCSCYYPLFPMVNIALLFIKNMLSFTAHHPRHWREMKKQKADLDMHHFRRINKEQERRAFCCWLPQPLHLRQFSPPNTNLFSTELFAFPWGFSAYPNALAVTIHTKFKPDRSLQNLPQFAPLPRFISTLHLNTLVWN